MENLRITENIQNNLLTATKWLKFMTILGTVGVALFFIIGIVLLFIPTYDGVPGALYARYLHAADTALLLPDKEKLRPDKEHTRSYGQRFADGTGTSGSQRQVHTEILRHTLHRLPVHIRPDTHHLLHSNHGWSNGRCHCVMP